jgi:hypothetical protein
MEVKADHSKGEMKICSKSLREGEEFMAQLREMVYGDQGTTMNFLNYVMNQKYWK